MNKIFLGAVFGLTIMGSAGASIISRGFFDEQIGNYATLDSLNSKANQKDLTALNDIVGKENWDIVLNLKNKDFPHLSELFPNLAPDKGMPIPDISNYIYDNLKLIDAPNLAGVTDKFLHGWTNSDGETYLGLKDVNTKIGVLPIGDMVVIPPMMNSLNGDIALPTSLSELIVRLFLGNSKSEPIISSIYRDIHDGLRNDGVIVVKGLSQLTSETGNVPQGTNLVDMIGANTKKIGDLPTKYQTVGAALSAIEGIAEEAKTLAEKAIPDPRAEGSSGKFVLTVDVIGDNATYHWEKIDRTLDETQTVSE
ncbi:MAG: hypothetical protein IJN91_04125 [Alphaproteobacteria bacterium]|nr:hypothetical protein [Alphaproteobacteria bacterium]